MWNPTPGLKIGCEHVRCFEGYVLLFPLCFLVGEGGAESHPAEGDSQSSGVQTEVSELSHEQVNMCCCAGVCVDSGHHIQIVDALVSVLCSELMMRDNLFEMVTSSRTFYIQVTHMKRTEKDFTYVVFWASLYLFAWDCANLTEGSCRHKS